jgi:hypothetical protein
MKQKIVFVLFFTREEVRGSCVRGKSRDGRCKGHLENSAIFAPDY